MNSFLPNTLLPARPWPLFWGSTFWPQSLRRQKRGFWRRWWGLQEGEVSGHGSGPSPGKTGQTWAAQAPGKAWHSGRPGRPATLALLTERLLWPGRAARAVGRRCPACFLPMCGWPGAPQPAQEITGAPRGRRAGPAPRPPREGRGHCRPLFQLPQHCSASERPLGASPTHSCPAFPGPTLGTGPPGPWALKGAGAGWK